MLHEALANLPRPSRTRFAETVAQASGRQRPSPLSQLAKQSTAHPAPKLANNPDVKASPPRLGGFVVLRASLNMPHGRGAREFAQWLQEPLTHGRQQS